MVFPGTYKFDAGKNGYVQVSDPLTGEKPLANEPNARIYADAIKFVPVNSAGAAASATPAVSVDMPGLPAAQTTPQTATAMPGLPSTTDQPGAAAQLPGLPNTTAGSSAAALPSLPGQSPSSENAMPALPAATPADVAQAMPSLPTAAKTPAAAGLPNLSAQPTATPAPVASAQVTPYPVPDLPSLAPVTPTPERDLPSPGDTPVAGIPAGLPGGPLSNLPPTPTPAVGMAAPTPFAPTMPGMTPAAGMNSAAAPAQPTPGGSITQYNPSNLQWMYDYGSALNAARSQNKKVMVFFTAAGNRAAEKYETEYFSHPAVRQALDNYILVKVDFPKNTRLGYSLGAFGAGIIVVTTPAGDVTARVVQLPPTPVDLIKQMAGSRPVQATPTPGPGPGAAAATQQSPAAATKLGSVPALSPIPQAQ